MDNNSIQLGDKVMVIKSREEDKSRFDTIHRGKCVGLSNSHCRVFRRKTDENDTSGDCEVSTSEWFTINSARLKTIKC